MIDLHGFTVHQAWKVFCDNIDRAKLNNKKMLVFITGRGQIESEFQGWISGNINCRFCEKLHPGCFKVYIRK